MLAHAGGGVHRVPLIRRYTASEQEIEFWRRYLEIVFADLFDSRPTAGSWCVSGAKEFKRSIDARTTSFQSHYLKTLGQPGLLDEAAWHCARFRESLYQTTSFQAGFGQPSPLVPIADDRYWLLAGLSRGAPHDASGQLSLSTWDSTLQALVKMVWVDFLGWAVQLSNLPTLALEIVPSAVAAFGARILRVGATDRRVVVRRQTPCGCTGCAHEPCRGYVIVRTRSDRARRACRVSE